MNRVSAAGSVLIPLLICACAGHKPSQSEQSAQAMQAARNDVSRVVPDAERREKLNATFDRYEDELRTFGGAVAAFQDRLRELNADPDASRDQFNDLIAGYQVGRKAARSRLVQIHHELLALTSEEEWRSIGEHEVEVLRLADAGEPAPRSKNQAQPIGAGPDHSVRKPAHGRCGCFGSALADRKDSE